MKIRLNMVGYFTEDYEVAAVPRRGESLHFSGSHPKNGGHVVFNAIVTQVIWHVPTNSVAAIVIATGRIL